MRFNSKKKDDLKHQSDDSSTDLKYKTLLKENDVFREDCKSYMSVEGID